MHESCLTVVSLMNLRQITEAHNCGLQPLEFNISNYRFAHVLHDGNFPDMAKSIEMFI
jgi:hypothetical protein